MIIAAILLVGGATLSAQSDTAENDPVKIAAALQSCDKGNVQSCYIYGSAIMAKNDPTNAEKKLAYQKLEIACSANIGMACYEAGVAYITGAAGKFDLKLARKYEVKGCMANDERACIVQKQLDNPPRTAKNLVKLPTDLQSKVNLALYVANDDGKLLMTYARVETANVNPQVKADMYEASCDLGFGAACADAAVIYNTPQQEMGPGKPIKKDSQRALNLARKGCAMDDGKSCLVVGVLIKDSGTMTNESHDGYRKSIPFLTKNCQNGDGSSCNFLGGIYRFGYGTRQDFPLAAKYYQMGCDNYARSGCQSAIEVRQIVENEENDRKREAGYRRERQEREEQERIAQANKPADTYDYSVSPKCMNNSNRFESEIKDFERQAGNLVANKDKNFNLLFDKSANTNAFYSLQKGKCINLRNIRQQAANDSCAIETLRAMDEMISQVCN